MKLSFTITIDADVQPHRLNNPDTPDVDDTNRPAIAQRIIDRIVSDIGDYSNGYVLVAELGPYLLEMQTINTANMVVER